jgi:hypothetical protein
MLFGVVYEAFLKAHRAADLMFCIKDSEPQASTKVT